MKKIFLAILPALLFAACKRMPIKTETRVYELTFIDGKTEIYTFNNVDVNAYEGIGNNRGGYYFYLYSSETYEHVQAIIRYKRIK
jgi:hypothetical protein